MVIFVFVGVVAACACFVVARDGVIWLSALLIQWVLHAWRVAQVSHGCIFIVFCKFFTACFVVVLNVLVAGDLRHEHAQSTWGFLFRGPPGSWLHSLHLHHSNWRFLWQWLLSWDEYLCDTHDVLMTPLLRSLARPPCGSKANCHSSPCCIRGMLVSWALWRFTMMALNKSIAISDGFDFWLHLLQLAMASLPVAACRNCFLTLVLCSQLGFLIV